MQKLHAISVQCFSRALYEILDVSFSLIIFVQVFRNTTTVHLHLYHAPFRCHFCLFLLCFRQFLDSMLKDSNFLILLAGIIFLAPSVVNAWWPFGDLGNSGFFNGFNNAPAQTNYIPVQQQQQPQPQQQQPYLQAIPMQQVPVQQQTHRAQPQNQAWWPFGSMFRL